MGKINSGVKRVFQIGFCGGWVEIYECLPHPQDQGAFVLVFRKRGARKVLPLMTGLTAGGAELITEHWRNRTVDLTKLCLLIGEKERSRGSRLLPVCGDQRAIRPDRRRGHKK